MEYYIQNLENDEYTLLENETEELIGATGETVNAEQKTFDHVTLDTSKSTLSGTVSGDGSLVLKVYYTRSVYTLSVSDSAYGSVEGARAYKTGEAPFTATAVPGIGCDFLGWYDSDDNCISTALTYHFAIDRNVRAKFQPQAKMAAFHFSATATSCTISGLKDRTVTEITIPDCVTAIGFTAFSGCKNLTSIDIHSSIISIGNLAFYGCTSLSEISIAPSVQSIGSNAFDGCSALTRISIPEGVAVIGDSTFNNCGILTTVNFGGSRDRWEILIEGIDIGLKPGCTVNYEYTED